MTRYIMMTVVAMAFYGQANACNYVAVKKAQSILDQANKSFADGLSTVTDTYEAKSHLLEMQLCQQPNDKEICQDLVASLVQTLDSEQVAYSAGVRTMPDVLSVHTKLVEAQLKCK